MSAYENLKNQTGDLPNNNPLRRDTDWQNCWQKVSLLPSNSTSMERRVEASMALLETVPVRHRHLWDPLSCPEHLLPWLAWALSVDMWDGAWPSGVKRAVLAASFARHRIKGTKASVIGVLSDHGLNPGIIEWFEETPKAKPYSFLVELDAVQSVRGTQSELSFDMLSLVNELVQVTKSLRSIYQIQVKAAFEAGVTAAPAMKGLSLSRLQAEPVWSVPKLTSNASAQTAAAVRHVKRTSLEPKLQSPEFSCRSNFASAAPIPKQACRTSLIVGQRNTNSLTKTRVACAVHVAFQRLNLMCNFQGFATGKEANKNLTGNTTNTSSALDPIRPRAALAFNVVSITR